MSHIHEDVKYSSLSDFQDWGNQTKEGEELAIRQGKVLQRED